MNEHTPPLGNTAIILRMFAEIAAPSYGLDPAELLVFAASARTPSDEKARANIREHLLVVLRAMTRTVQTGRAFNDPSNN